MQAFRSTTFVLPLRCYYFPAALFHSAIFALLSALSLLDKLLSSLFGDRERDRLDLPLSLSLDRSLERERELRLFLSLERERERERLLQ